MRVGPAVIATADTAYPDREPRPDQLASSHQVRSSSRPCSHHAVSRVRDASPINTESGPILTIPYAHPLLRRYVRRLAQERQHLPRFLLSRLIWRTGLGPVLRLRIRLREGPVVRFDTSALAATLWLSQEEVLVQERVLLERRLSAGDVVVDVGANIGVLALVAGRRVGPQGRVIAVEPHPRTFAALARNVRENDMPWVECLCLACGTNPGVARLTDRVSDDQNSVVSHGTEATIEVPVQPIDHLLGAVESVALLKIDVEGFEKHVLQGAQRTLSITRAVYCECSRPLAAEHGYDADEIIGLLESAEFTVLDADTMTPVLRPWIRHGAGNLLALRDTTALDLGLRSWTGGEESGLPEVTANRPPRPSDV